PGSEVTADPELAAEHERAQEALDRAKATVEAVRSAVAGPKRALSEARGGGGAARDADQEAQRAVAAPPARIEARERAVGGAGPGGEVRLAADRDGVLGTMAALLTVEPGAEVAVATALGAAAEAVAVASLDTAEAALTLLRDAAAGRAGIVVGAGPATAGR